MYRKDDNSYFIVDAHIALWDARARKPAQRPRQAVHRLLLRLPPQPVTRIRGVELRGIPLPGRRAADEGPVRRRLRRSRHLPAGAARRVLLQGVRADRRGVRPRLPTSGQLTYNHNFDPRNGEAGLDQLREDAKKFRLKGVKLYTPRSGTASPVAGDSTTRGHTATSRPAANSESATSTCTRARRSGHWTATRSTSPTSTTWHRTFTDLNFVVEHCGLPRLEDFCWIATQEPNVHAGLAVAMPFIHTRPSTSDKSWASSSTGWARTASSSRRTTHCGHPRWLVERFVDFQIPDQLDEYAPITHRPEEEDPRAERGEDVRHPGARRAPTASR